MNIENQQKSSRDSKIGKIALAFIALLIPIFFVISFVNCTYRDANNKLIIPLSCFDSGAAKRIKNSQERYQQKVFADCNTYSQNIKQSNPAIDINSVYQQCINNYGRK